MIELVLLSLYCSGVNKACDRMNGPKATVASSTPEQHKARASRWLAPDPAPRDPAVAGDRRVLERERH